MSHNPRLTTKNSSILTQENKTGTLTPTTYSYDRSKNLTSIVKPSGKTITNTYNNGRLESTQTPEGTTNYSYLFASKVGSITQGSESFT